MILTRELVKRSPLARSKRPEVWNEEYGDAPEDDVEGYADAGVVGEAVAARCVDEGVCLVADRCGEAGRGGECDGAEAEKIISEAMQSDQGLSIASRPSLAPHVLGSRLLCRILSVEQTTEGER